MKTLNSGIPAVIDRDGYVSQMLRLRGNGLVKVLTGIQSSYRLVGDEQTERELLPLRKSGDFFRKIVVTYGSAKPREDAEGITHVGIIPFLLDESILG